MVSRDLGAPGFQADTAAKLAEIFASQRNEKLDLSGVVVIDPQLAVLPQIERHDADGRLLPVGAGADPASPAPAVAAKHAASKGPKGEAAKSPPIPKQKDKD